VCVPTIEVPRSSHRIAIRIAEERDLAALAVLDEEVFADVAYSRAYLRTLFDLFNETWYVAEDGGKLAGYSLVGFNPRNTQARLIGLAVASQYRGTGLGRRLMVEAEAAMVEHKVYDGYITVRPDNDAAKHLYDSFGFKQEGEEREDYYGNGEPRQMLHRSFRLALTQEPEVSP
jgi:[ribosomal protein S18]-alanine N-acetyltransferase